MDGGGLVGAAFVISRMGGAAVRFQGFFTEGILDFRGPAQDGIRYAPRPLPGRVLMEWVAFSFSQSLLMMIVDAS